MKNLVLLTMTLISLQTLAEQTVNCTVKPEEYANNQLPAQTVPPLALKISIQDAVLLAAEIPNTTYQVRPGYQVQFSGYLTKPGNRWVKGQSSMLIEAQLSRSVEAGPYKILAKHVSSSDTLERPQDLTDLQAGAVKASMYLQDVDYLNDQQNGVNIAKDQLVGVQIHCELAK